MWTPHAPNLAIDSKAPLVLQEKMSKSKHNGVEPMEAWSCPWMHFLSLGMIIIMITLCTLSEMDHPVTRTLMLR